MSSFGRQSAMMSSCWQGWWIRKCVCALFEIVRTKRLVGALRLTTMNCGFLKRSLLGTVISFIYQDFGIHIEYNIVKLVLCLELIAKERWAAIVWPLGNMNMILSKTVQKCNTAFKSKSVQISRWVQLLGTMTNEFVQLAKKLTWQCNNLMEQSKMEEAIMKHIGWVETSNFNSAPTQVTATKDMRHVALCLHLCDWSTSQFVWLPLRFETQCVLTNTGLCWTYFIHCRSKPRRPLQQ